MNGTRAPERRSYPSSHGQRLLWLADRLGHEGMVFNIASVHRIRGPLDAAVLRRALAVVVSRHGALRTCLEEHDGLVTQVVARDAEIPLTIHDVSGRKASMSPARALLERAIDRRFDLTRAPLAEVTLVRLAREDHVLSIVMHHIVSDGWSLGVFHRELSACYEAECRAAAPDVPDLPVQFVDFVASQLEWFGPGTGTPEERFWAGALADADGDLPLPFDRAMPARSTRRGEQVSTRLPDALRGDIETLARRREITPFVVMLAAYQALLLWYSGRDDADITVGTPLSGRTHAEVEPLIGFFVNNVVIRTRLRSALPFSAILDLVRDAVLDALHHGEFPLSKLILEPQSARPGHRGGTGRPAFYRLWFAFHNEPVVPLRLSELDVSPMAIERRHAWNDLALAITFGEGTCDAALTYDADRFERTTAERLLHDYRGLLTMVVGDPESATTRAMTALHVDSVARTLGQGRAAPPPPERRDGTADGSEIAESLAFWGERLTEATTILDLPTDHPRRAVNQFHEAVYRFVVPASTVAGLEAAAGLAGTTALVALVATFAVMLSRWSGQIDMVLGCRGPASGAGPPDIFIVRVDLSGGPSFRALLRRLDDVTCAAKRHARIDLARVIEAVTPGRDVGRAPLFQAAIVLDDPDAAPAPRLGRGAASPDTTRGTRLDLTLRVRPAGHTLAAVFEYAAELFEPTTITRMAQGLLAVAAALAAAPDLAVDDAPLLSAADRDRLLHQAHGPASVFPHGRSIHELFAERSAHTPHRVALIAGERRVTYEELARQVHELAGRLAGHGMTRGARVGIYIERSIAMVVAVLAALEAGGAYVPLDPAYPEDRLRRIVADASPAVVLMSTASGECLSLDVRTILVEDTASDAAPAVAARWRPARPDDPAYVVYTSGSTGRPKGVVNTHAGLVNRLWWQWTAFPPEPGDVVCHKTSLNFVDGTTELLGALLWGVPLVIATSNDSRDPRALADLIRRHTVTRVTVVPSLLTALLDHAADLTSLRVCVSSGETLARPLAERFHSRLPRTRLLNLYGSSEANGDSLWCDVEPSARAVPLGRPIANTSAYVLDRRMQVVPAGVVGELYVGGVGLAAGYLADAALTAERFVPDPFATECPRGRAGARLYRTGDLARWTAGGEIEFVGRRDHRVKIRGVRIELGEIELALLRQPGVRDAVVVSRDHGGEARLVAYWVADSSGADASAVRAGLRRMLPDAMIPSAFVRLPAFPLTATGKVDRRALPPPDGPALGIPYVAPRTAVEREVAAIWSEVLKLERVGVDEDFLERGGHSLLATQIMARVADVLKVELPVRVLFEAPTVAELSQRIERECGRLPSA